MDKKYLSYSVEELIQDSEFVAYVLDKKEKEKWDAFQFQANNPDFESKVKSARRIIFLLRDSTYKLSHDEVYTIWKNIDDYSTDCDNLRKKNRFKVFLRYAAIALLFIGIGGYGGYYISSQQPQFKLSKVTNKAHLDEAKLILSSGEEYNLNKDDSAIEVNSSNNSIKINNENIVNLKEEANPDEPHKMNELIIPYGKKTTLMLADGTKVWLNAGSHLAFPSYFKDNTREVYLEGEAYFEVAEDTERPFHVNIDRMKVKVLGTSFNVSAYTSDSQIKTVLLEGKVAISEKSQLGFFKKDVILLPYQMAVLDMQTNLLTVQNEPDILSHIGWTEGFFQFSKESLESVFTKVERYYNVNFIYDPSISKTFLITGKLDLKDSLKEVLTVLSDLAKINYRISGNKIIIEKKIEKMPMRN